MALISVCIPAFNRSRFLSALLDSILEQDYDDFDIVIAEDSSPERQAIAEKVYEYQRRYGDKIKYYENSKTLGYDANLRRLLELATGDYVLFMGNDDLLAPDALSTVANALKKHDNVGVLLRSYSSFIDNPQYPKQVFRYFSEDRFFSPSADTVVTFFRRCVFISGMVYKRDSANIYSTSRFDGTLLYQLHLAGRILMRESGLYLNRILSHHRLGGIPDFGVSAAEKDLFVPKNQTPESSIHFIRGMLIIAYSLDEESTTKVGHRILRDIANYSYPILSIQADRSFRVFVIYIWQLLKLGFWRAPLFYIYAIGLILLGRKNCDRLIGCLKKLLGRSPLIGVIYSGKSTQIKDR